MTEPIPPLHVLADAAGLQRQWRDVDGCDHEVTDESLITILEALGFRAGNSRAIATSLRRIERDRAKLPAMVVADAGGRIALPFPCTRAVLLPESGAKIALEIHDGAPVAPSEPGYYRIEVDGEGIQLAVAPPRCPSPPTGGRRAWGTSLQIPSLRGSRKSEFGDLGALAEAVNALASAGADAVAINPVHALFPGYGERFSPYSPSSRRFLNGAIADPALCRLAPLPQSKGEQLICWESALPECLSRLRELFDALPAERRAEIIGRPDEATRFHAIFDALDVHFRSGGAKGWRDWPTSFQAPRNKAVSEFAASNAEEVDFHLFVQALAREGIGAVQERATAAGMSIGLIGDLAVGVDPGGSDCWALGEAMMGELTIGAPPDPLGPLGQNWGITSFSPEGLRRTGYEPWIAMIRAALAHGGGLRIDHAFALARLWVIPAGCDSSQGAYLSYPFDDLIRLLTLEAHLAGAFIVAEDLGTAPPGFSAAIAERNILGMRVLWFERAEDSGFIGAQDYDPQAVAMSGTHDTPTLAGWWRGTDLDWAERLGRLPAGVDRAKAEEIREWDRGLLWSSIAGNSPRPARSDPQPAVTAAIAHIARTPCALAIVPIEDILGEEEQPNIPGTISEHPNWRRRFAAPLEDLLSQSQIEQRIATIDLHRDGRSSASRS